MDDLSGRFRDSVTIDCATCVARETDACDDCLVTAVLGGPPGRMELDAPAQAAVIELLVAGLVPPVRYRPAG